MYDILGGYVGLFIGYTISQVPLFLISCISWTRKLFRTITRDTHENCLEEVSVLEESTITQNDASSEDESMDHRPENTKKEGCQDYLQDANVIGN